LIVGILAFTFQFARNLKAASQKSFSGLPAPPGLRFAQKQLAQSEIAPTAHL
jgi:hypothetical protein